MRNRSRLKKLEQNLFEKVYQLFRILLEGRAAKHGARSDALESITPSALRRALNAA